MPDSTQASVDQSASWLLGLWCKVRGHCFEPFFEGQPTVEAVRLGGKETGDYKWTMKFNKVQCLRCREIRPVYVNFENAVYSMNSTA